MQPEMQVPVFMARKMAGRRKKSKGRRKRPLMAYCGAGSVAGVAGSAGTDAFMAAATSGLSKQV